MHDISFMNYHIANITVHSESKENVGTKCFGVPEGPMSAKIASPLCTLLVFQPLYGCVSPLCPLNPLLSALCLLAIRRPHCIMFPMSIQHLMTFRRLFRNTPPAAQHGRWALISQGDAEKPGVHCAIEQCWRMEGVPSAYGGIG